VIVYLHVFQRKYWITLILKIWNTIENEGISHLMDLVVYAITGKGRRRTQTLKFKKLLNEIQFLNTAQGEEKRKL